MTKYTELEYDGTILLDPEDTLQARLIYKPVTYSTHDRAAKYGNCRDPSPITMLTGRVRWVARPFWSNRAYGGFYTYREIDFAELQEIRNNAKAAPTGHKPKGVT
jgi:hypothetical protein